MFSVRLSTIIRGFLAALLCSAAALASDLKVSVESPSGERVSGVQVSLFRVTDNAGVGVQTTAGDGTATFPHLRRRAVSRWWCSPRDSPRNRNKFLFRRRKPSPSN